MTSAASETRTAAIAESLIHVTPMAVSLRRRLHMHPEASHEEHATTAAIVDVLHTLRPRVLGSGTGVVVDVGPGAPTVALRADIDALRMADAKDAPYRSRVPGVCHACGHDVHTAVVVGAALVLEDLAELGLLEGGVRLLFEPGEESVPGGAVEIVRSGFLVGIEQIFGLHCDPRTAVGQVGSRVGSITSASDRLEIFLSGPGGHTARPHETVNLIAELGALISVLPNMVQERIGADEEVRLVFGSISAGAAPNVIPASATLTGTIRTPHSGAWERFSEVVPAAVAEALHLPLPHVGGIDMVTGRGLRSDGLALEVRLTRGVPPVVNHADPTAVLAAAARRFLGDDAIVETPHSWGGDSYGWYLKETPGTYARLGTRGPQSPLVDLHSPDFDVDERAIGIGIRLLVESALGSLARTAATGVTES